MDIYVCRRLFIYIRVICAIRVLFIQLIVFVYIIFPEYFRVLRRRGAVLPCP